MLLALTVVGAGLRVFRLTRWPLEGDELHTLRDSLSGGWPSGAKKQLLFFLNDMVVAPWIELDEFGLRLLPFIFGVAAIPVLYGLVRRAFGAHTAILSCAILTFSPWHIYWSQNARYYTLVFLLSMTFALALHIGSREGRLRWTLLGLASGLLAILAHPSSGVVVVGCGLWLGGHHLREWFRSRSVEGRSGLAAFIGVAVIGGLTIGIMVPQLLSWREFGEPWGHSAVPLVLSYGNWIGTGVGLFAMSGLVWMWWEGRKSLALFMASWWIVPTVIFALLSYIVAVSVSYLFVTAPAVVVLAGSAVARITAAIPKIWPRTIALSAVMGTLILAPAPSLVSHYLDGGRADFRAAADLIEGRATDADIILGDRDGALNHYLTSHGASELASSDVQLETELVSVGAQGGANLWLAVHLQMRGGFNERSLSGIETWVQDRCILEAMIGRPRVDFKGNFVQVYRCPSSTRQELRP